MAGFINSLYLAVGPIARLFIGQIHSTIKARSRWDCSFSISVPLSEKLHFWFSNIKAFNGDIRDSAEVFPRFSYFFVMPMTMPLVDSKLD